MSEDEIRPASKDDPSEVRPIVPVDSDAGPVERIPRPVLEMPDPAPEDEERESETTARLKVIDFGGPDDASDEKPVIVRDNSSDVHPRLDEATPSELQEAYECLEIRTPLEELRTYASARLEALLRMGEEERAETTSAALDVGLNALREVMGAVTRRRDTP